MVQSLAKLNGCLAVVAEPYNVPDHLSWSGSEDGSVAAYFWWSNNPESSVFSPLGKGRRHVTVKWRELVVIGGYFSPTRPFQEFEAYLGELELAIRRYGARPVLVLKDFNSKSTIWGNPRTDVRGRALEELAAACNLVVLKEGTRHTCVRRDGGSIVDVTLASPSAVRRVNKSGRTWKPYPTIDTSS
ncbi:uncharacterized protein LOC109860635 [Pseudomyrmex gracilis]|uniref:uncharacterized protein LOC109860635 n=1 Tax=Pseudomyrmex gracilis TaxID=219809 RepID=UPI0009957E63|nr:uncharacterized protein LOC109860635 [Pseudomyrmex gracilis]